MTTIRTFIAIPIVAPAALRSVCHELTRMGRPMKAVAVEDLHLTLRFLGQTQLDQIRPVCQAIRSVAGQVIHIELSGLGAFPHARRARAVWAGVRHVEPVASMVEALQGPLAALGWEPDGRVWKAHITLARVNGRPPTPLVNLLASNRDTHFGCVTVRSIVLMQSRFGQRGARYVPLETVALQ